MASTRGTGQNIRELVNAIRGFGGSLPSYLANALERLQNAIDRIDKDVLGHGTQLTSLTNTVSSIAPPSTSAPSPATPLSASWGYDSQGLWIKIQRTPPSPLGSYKGDHVYLEIPDQSAGGRYKLGNALGSGNLVGDWRPIDGGKSDYDPNNPGPAVVEGLPEPSQTTSIRAYLNPYSETYEPALVRSGNVGATPSIVFSVDPRPKYEDAEDYAPNVTSLSVSIGTDHTDHGVLLRPLTFSATLPSSPLFQGWEIVSVWPDGSQYVESPVITTSSFTLDYQTVKSLDGNPVNVVFYARTVGTDKNGNQARNTIRPGVTPSVVVDVSSPGGVLDLGKTLASTIASHLQVQSGVLGVAPQGITNALIAANAVGNTHLDRVTVNKIAIQDADIVNLSANKITAGTLAANVIYSGTINANQINAGTMNGVAVHLTANGITTDISNSYVNLGGYLSPTAMTATSSQGTMGILPDRILGVSPSGLVKFALGPVDILLYDYSGNLVAYMSRFGTIYCSSGYFCQGLQGLTGSYNIGGRTVQINGGIITNIV